MICENCKKEYSKKYGSGRFCSPKCARGFSTKEKRKEINKKVSKKLKGKLTGRYIPLSEEARKKQAKSLAEHYSRIWEKLLLLPWEDFLKERKDSKTIKKRVLHEQENKCNRCSLDKWLGEPITLQLHHKDGDIRNSARNNIECLCPNCHSQTENYGNKNERSYRKNRIKNRKT